MQNTQHQNASASAHSSMPDHSMPDLSQHSKQTHKPPHFGKLLSESEDDGAVKKARARKPGRRDGDALTIASAFTQVSTDQNDMVTNASNLNAANTNRRLLDSNLPQKAGLKLPDLHPTDTDFGPHLSVYRICM